MCTAPTAAPSDPELIRLFRAGDRTAIAALIDRHSGLVISIVNGLKPGPGVDKDDLKQAGYLAVCAAAKKGWIDDGRSKFSTYCYAAVLNRVRKELLRLTRHRPPADPGIGAETAAAPEPADPTPGAGPVPDLPPLLAAVVAATDDSPDSFRRAAEDHGLDPQQARRMLRPYFRPAARAAGARPPG